MLKALMLPLACAGYFSAAAPPPQTMPNMVTQGTPSAGAAKKEFTPMEVAEAAAQAARLAAEASKQTAESVTALLRSRAIGEGYAPVAMPEASAWSHTLGLSALAVGGNANSNSAKLDAGMDGHWRDWNTELRLSSSYGQTSAPSNEPALQPQVTAYKLEATARGQRNYNPVLGAYLLVGGLVDRVASIDWQGYGEGGLSLLWWEHIRADFLRSRLRTSLGFRATREHHFQFYPVQQRLPDAFKNIFGPTVTGNFRFGLSRSVYVFEEAFIYQDAMVSRDLRFNSNTGISAQINQRVSLSVTYKIRYYGLPSDNKKTTDSELATGISWTS
jgi:putative salt-induced outer membrane protein YdiY